MSKFDALHVTELDLPHEESYEHFSRISSSDQFLFRRFKIVQRKFENARSLRCARLPLR